MLYYLYSLRLPFIGYMVDTTTKAHPHASVNWHLRLYWLTERIKSRCMSLCLWHVLLVQGQSGLYIITKGQSVVFIRDWQDHCILTMCHQQLTRHYSHQCLKISSIFQSGCLLNNLLNMCQQLQWLQNGRGALWENLRGTWGACGSSEVIENYEMTSPQFFRGFVWCFSWPRLPASTVIKKPGCVCAHQLISSQSVWPTGALQPPFTSLLDNARRALLVALCRASSSALWTFARFYILITSSHKNAFSAHQPPPADLFSWQGSIREKESQRSASSDWAHQQIRRRKGVREGEAIHILGIGKFKEFGAEISAREE